MIFFMSSVNWRTKVSPSIAVAFALFLSSCSNLNWISVQKDQDLHLRYSWEELKKPSEEGAEMRLHVWVNNENSSALEYDLGVEFFVNGKMEESSGVTRKCAKGGISYKGKLNGTYFEPITIKAGDVRDSIVTVEFAPLNVELIETCKD